MVENLADNLADLADSHHCVTDIICPLQIWVTLHTMHSLLAASIAILNLQKIVNNRCKLF